MHKCPAFTVVFHQVLNPKPTLQVFQFCQMGDKSLLGILGGQSRSVGGNQNEQKLFFITFTNKNPTSNSREISEHVLFQYLLNDYASPPIKEKFKTCKLLPIPREIDPESKITQVETHRRSGKPILKTGPFNIFVVFKTVSEKDGDCWWSVEETVKHTVILQRSRDKDSIKKKFKETELIADELEGKG